MKLNLKYIGITLLAALIIVTSSLVIFEKMSTKDDYIQMELSSEA